MKKKQKKLTQPKKKIPQKNIFKKSPQKNVKNSSQKSF